MRFEPSKADPCLLLKKEGSLVVVLIYVDDILGVGREAHTEPVIRALLDKYGCHDLGEVTSFLHGHRARPSQPHNQAQPSGIRQESGAEVALGNWECRPRSTPLSAKLERPGDTLHVGMPYAGRVGNLLFLSTCSRPVITYAVSQLARFISAPTKQHWNEALGIVRYVAGTIDYGLVFSSPSPTPWSSAATATLTLRVIPIRGAL
eukprot:365665-Chlamydomonas_euryale.AAC.25